MAVGGLDGMRPISCNGWHGEQNLSRLRRVHELNIVADDVADIVNRGREEPRKKVLQPRRSTRAHDSLLKGANSTSRLRLHFLFYHLQSVRKPLSSSGLVNQGSR